MLGYFLACAACEREVDRPKAPTPSVEDLVITITDERKAVIGSKVYCDFPKARLSGDYQKLHDLFVARMSPYSPGQYVPRPEPPMFNLFVVASPNAHYEDLWMIWDVANMYQACAVAVVRGPGASPYARVRVVPPDYDDEFHKLYFRMAREDATANPTCEITIDSRIVRRYTIGENTEETWAGLRNVMVASIKELKRLNSSGNRPLVEPVAVFDSDPGIPASTVVNVLFKLQQSGIRHIEIEDISDGTR